MTTTHPIGETNKDGFEITTCGRCGGSGSYSFCTMHGSTCFGCGGSGKVFTKRGYAAKAHLKALRQRAVADLQVGDWLWDDTFGYKPKWLPITEIKQDTHSTHIIDGIALPPGKTVYTRRGGFGGLQPTNMVTSVRGEEERKATLAAAIAYQGTLGKNGKPTKAAKTAEAA